MPAKTGSKGTLVRVRSFSEPDATAKNILIAEEMNEQFEEAREKWVAVFSYSPIEEDELEFQEGENILVVEKCNDGYFI